MILNGNDFLTYKELLDTADNEGLTVMEKPLTGSDGRIYKNRIAIRSGIDTTVEKSCVLAEELGHYYTSSGDILDQSDTMNRKQEYRARLYGYNLKVGLMGIINSYESGARNLYEMAEYLDCAEEYLKEAIDCYKSKYDEFVKLDNYIIYFIPYFAVMKIATKPILYTERT